MGTAGKKIDWSDKNWGEMLVYQRKSAVHTVYRNEIAAFYGLRPGMTIVDVGCGLGFMGSNYWRYYGEGGHYIGVDSSPDLIRSAQAGSVKWAVNGRASFMSGSAYCLPLGESSADCLMCQTLLMHLDDPHRALTEMIRVTKPGGAIVCQEPDNLSARLIKPEWSLPEEDIGDYLLKIKVILLSNRGRIKLGLGDKSIGPKVYILMKQLGLTDVDVRTSPYVPHLYPPYGDEQEQNQLEMVRKQHLDQDRLNALRECEKEEFLAGGGSVEEWERYCEASDKMVAQLRQQINEGRYYYCHVYPFYYTRGRKPTM